jgi:hypothetical protein
MTRLSKELLQLINGSNNQSEKEYIHKKKKEEKEEERRREAVDFIAHFSLSWPPHGVSLQRPSFPAPDPRCRWVSGHFSSKPGVSGTSAADFGERGTFGVGQDCGGDAEAQNRLFLQG